ncbi:MAG: hypothetical protein LBF97_02305, partial [Elusimicrobiota bacterium]|nr:hypothetical protein [Elusimicrobiota bacterium]
IWKRLLCYKDEIGSVTLFNPNDARRPNHPLWHIEVPPVGYINSGADNIKEWYSLDWKTKKIGNEQNFLVDTKNTTADEMMETKEDLTGDGIVGKPSIKEVVRKNKLYEKVDYCIDGNTLEYIEHDAIFNQLTITQGNILRLKTIAEYNNDININKAKYQGEILLEDLYTKHIINNTIDDFSHYQNGDEFIICGNGKVNNGNIEWHTGDKLTLNIQNFVGSFDASRGTYNSLNYATTNQIYNVSIPGIIYGQEWKKNDKIIILNGPPTSKEDVAKYKIQETDVLQTVSYTLGAIKSAGYVLMYVFDSLSDDFSLFYTIKKEVFKYGYEGCYIAVFDNTTGRNKWIIKKIVSNIDLLSSSYQFDLLESNIGKFDGTYVYGFETIIGGGYDNQSYPGSIITQKETGFDVTSTINDVKEIKNYEEGVLWTNQQLQDLKSDLNYNEFDMDVLTKLKKDAIKNFMKYKLHQSVPDEKYYSIIKRTVKSNFSISTSHPSNRNYVFLKLEDAVKYDASGNLIGGYFFEHPDEMYNMAEFYIEGETNVLKNGLYRFKYKRKILGTTIYNTEEGKLYRFIGGIHSDGLKEINFYGRMVVSDDYTNESYVDSNENVINYKYYDFAKIYEYDSHYRYYEEEADEDDFIFYNNDREKTREISGSDGQIYYDENSKHRVEFANINGYIYRPIYDIVKKDYKEVEDGIVLLQYILERTVNGFNYEEIHRRAPENSGNDAIKYSLLSIIEWIVETGSDTIIEYYTNIELFILDYYKYVILKINPPEDKDRLKYLLGSWDGSKYENEHKYTAAIQEISNILNTFIYTKNVGYPNNKIFGTILSDDVNRVDSGLEKYQVKLLNIVIGDIPGTITFDTSKILWWKITEPQSIHFEDNSELISHGEEFNGTILFIHPNGVSEIIYDSSLSIKWQINNLRITQAVDTITSPLDPQTYFWLNSTFISSKKHTAQDNILGYALNFKEVYDPFNTEYDDIYSDDTIIDGKIVESKEIITHYKNYIKQFTNSYEEFSSPYHEFKSLLEIILSGRETLKNYLISFLYNEELIRYRERFFDDNDGFKLIPSDMNFSREYGYPKLRAYYNGG